MSGATRGIYLERRAAEILSGHGWFTIRAAGSHGVADVVAIAPAVVVFVQCKTDGQMGGTEWNRLWEVSGTCGAIPVLCQYRSMTHRSLMWLELTGPHKRNSRDWPHITWLPTDQRAVPRMDPETAAKVAELELERLNRPHGRP